MIRVVSSLSPLKRRVVSLSFLFKNLRTQCRFCSSAPLSQSSHLDSQPLCFSGIAHSVLSRSSHLLLDKENDKGRNFDHNVSYKELLLEISDIVPELARRFRRVSELSPQDVVEILLGFESECERAGSRARKVVSLWELFKWASDQHQGFRHLPQSWEVMSRVLVRFGLFREFEFLFMEMERRGVLGCNETLSNLIQGYVLSGDSNRAVSMYDRMKRRGLAPTESCYHGFLGHLVQTRKAKVAFRVCMDLVEMGIGSNESSKMALDGVIRLLCADGKIQEARSLVRKVMDVGFEVNRLDINGIVYGYCEKRDFDDILRFYREIKCAPDILAGNRIVHLMCSFFNSERSQLVMEKLESLGFVPDEITFGILIGWCCQEGKLRSAFAYLEEMFLRGLKPLRNSYNALICCLFLKGMWKHSRDVIEEMIEKGVNPDISTFCILLAGYCRGRQFDEVKKTVSDMENLGLIRTDSLKSQISRAFSVLGFDPLAVRLKRDEDLNFSKSDFFDELGNGIYLDTDLTEYERKVVEILESGLVPDYNFLITKQCVDKEMKLALALADEMIQWGQELSLISFSDILKVLCSNCDSIQVYEIFLEKNSKLFHLLGREALNSLVQVFCERGWTDKGKLVFDSMVRRGLKIDNETFTAIIAGLCKMGSFTDLRYWWDIARNAKWVPRLEHCGPLLQCLCSKEMLKESLDLLETMLVSDPHLRTGISHLFLEKLSSGNLSRVSGVLLEELIRRGCVLDSVAYGYVVRGMCGEREFSSALKILDSLMVKNIIQSLEISVSLIPQLCIAGRYEEAISLREMTLRESPASSLLAGNALLKGFCMTMKVQEAISVLREMSLKGIALNVETFDILVEGFCKVNNSVKVRELLGLMMIKGFDLSIQSYRNLVTLMCLEGKVSQAFKLKEFMLKKGESRDLVIYNILMFQLFSTGNSLLVNKVLDDLQKKQVELDGDSFNFLVYGFAKCGDSLKALKYLSAMISKGLRPKSRSLRATITTLCSSMEIEKALLLSREMEARGWLHDSVVQNSMAELLISLGKISEAEKFLERIAEKNLVPKKNVNYDNLVKRFCSCKRLEKAVGLVNAMLKSGTVPSSTSYDCVIVSCCENSDLDRAADFHTEMLDRGLRPSVDSWNHLVHRFHQHGRTAEAEGFLVSMVGIGETPSRDTFVSFIERYRFENNPRKALEVVEIMQRSGFKPDFETHWSIIGGLRKSNDEANNKGKEKGFLSSLLSNSGFFDKK